MFTDNTFKLPLFPLQAVLFPGGLLSLKVFEARYLDLVTHCLRNQSHFGVVALETKNATGSEAGKNKPGDIPRMESTGVVAELLEVDSAQAGILQVRCKGLHRFDIKTSRQETDGLWVARVSKQADDLDAAPADDMVDTVRALASAIGSLKDQGSTPFLEPYRFDSASWVANRWCEILPISLAAKQKLMELPDGLARLQLVRDFLRNKGVVS
jgi:Lon protease-like protein